MHTDLCAALKSDPVLSTQFLTTATSCKQSAAFQSSPQQGHEPYNNVLAKNILATALSESTQWPPA